MVRRCASRSAACALSVTPRAAPKSVTLTWPAPVRRTFSGLRSPKQKPTSWIASSAATIEPRTKTVACVSRAPSPTTAEWRSPLAAYSSTRYASDRHRKLERRRATPGCEMRANTAISRAICATLSSSFGRASHRHGPLDVAFVFVLYDFGPRDNLHRIFGPGRPGECMLSGRSSLEDAARVLDHAKCATPKFFAKDEIVKFEIWEDGRRFSSQSRRPSASSGVGRALS
mmetsp:Transcript_18770/g.61170  ORF Transcript_18770/g.61170 Transcript_18770/m.61170 type:complete len:229 (+) Transcript_18770:1186-1872(+)